MVQNVGSSNAGTRIPDFGSRGGLMLIGSNFVQTVLELEELKQIRASKLPARLFAKRAPNKSRLFAALLHCSNVSRGTWEGLAQMPRRYSDPKTRVLGRHRNHRSCTLRS